MLFYFFFLPLFSPAHCLNYLCMLATKKKKKKKNLFYWLLPPPSIMQPNCTFFFCSLLVTNTVVYLVALTWSLGHEKSKIRTADGFCLPRFQGKSHFFFVQYIMEEICLTSCRGHYIDQCFPCGAFQFSPTKISIRSKIKGLKPSGYLLLAFPLVQWHYRLFLFLSSTRIP